MSWIGIFLLTLVALESSGHNGHQAFYTLSVENGTLILESKLEIPDLEKVVASSETCAAGQDFNWCVGTWLVDRISISIDGKTYALKLESSFTEDGHLILTHSLGQKPESAQTIELGITAFIDVIPDYENLFETTLSEEKIGFKLDKDRTTTTINLKP